METNWVRSVYLYMMCAVALLLVAAGLMMGVMSVARMIDPGLGHRDTLDRVGVGLSNVAVGVVDILDSQQLDSIRSYCEEWESDDVAGCIEENSSSASMGPVIEGIGAVKAEIESQIRDTALATLIKAVLMIIVGALLWWFHAGRTELYRDGLRPKRPKAETAPTPESAPQGLA